MESAPTNYAEHQTRPRNLVPDNNPEREALIFDTHVVLNAPEEVQNLIENIKEVASHFLFKWKSFPLTLPAPISPALLGLDVNDRRVLAELKDSFILPPFDELDALACDDLNGESKKLSDQQFNSIRDSGQFCVPSINFEGQNHLWQLHTLLQKGKCPTKDAFNDDIAMSIKFLIVIAKERIIGDFFSMKSSLRSLLRGILNVLDIFIGMPSLKTHNLKKRVIEERAKFLIAELSLCDEDGKMMMLSLCKYITKQLKRATIEKVNTHYHSREQDLSIPYFFKTPQNQEIDFRLFSKDLMRTALPIINNIIERETRGWFLPFREKLITELRAKNRSLPEIEEIVNNEVMKEYLRRIYSSILSNNELKSLGTGIVELLIQQAQSMVIIQNAIIDVRKTETRRIAEKFKHLQVKHPILSRIENWVKSQLEEDTKCLISDCDIRMWTEAIEECMKHNLTQTAYFLRRDLTFVRDREEILIKELQMDKSPTRSFQFARRIWLAKNWITKRNFQGVTEVIPTTISNQVTTIVTPRTSDRQPVFLVEKEVFVTTTSRYVFWRFLNLLHRITSYTFNAMFLFLYFIPYQSALSLRTVIEIKPFTSDLELSQINGTLFPGSSSRKTVCYRLISLWRGISKSRTHFESQPDTGFLERKGLRRFLNILWNYVGKGFFGSIATLVFLPLLCILACAGSVTIGIFTPVLATIGTILLHLFMILFYDFDNPRADESPFFILFKVIGRDFILQGFLQLILTFLTAAVLCPLISAAIFMAGLSRYLIRTLWDETVFQCFIRKSCRVPSSDTIAVKRISGPGFMQEFHYLITPPQALSALINKVELEILETWKKNTEELVEQPKTDFIQFVEACFKPFSTQLAPTGEFRRIERSCQNLLIRLREKVERRKNELSLSLSQEVRAKVKMTSADLKTSIVIGATLLERIYSNENILKRSNDEEFWEEKFLSPDDWSGLTALLYTEIFSLNFITPVSDDDVNSYRLQSVVDLSVYEEIIQNFANHEEINKTAPDLIDTVYSPSANVRFETPHLEISAFNPRSKHLEMDRSRVKSSPKIERFTKKLQFWKYWGQNKDEFKLVEKLLNPLPIPHPASITVLVYNRDVDNPLPIDSDICHDILRSIEDSCMRFDAKSKSSFSENDEGHSSYLIEDENKCAIQSLSPRLSAVGSEKNSPGSFTYPQSLVLSENSLAQPNTITWTLHRMELNRISTEGFAQVGLASPEEDISISMDEHHILLSSKKNFDLGTNV